MPRTAAPKVVTAKELPGPSRSATSPSGIWVDRLEALGVAKKPGLWFRVYEAEDADKAANNARNINHQRVKLPPGQWKASARTDRETGKSYVWVQFLGP